jgi:hypothetical protein
MLRHNSGKVPHTTKWKPWRIKTYIASPTQNALSNSNAISNPHLAALLLKSTFDQFARNVADDEDCRT